MKNSITLNYSIFTSFVILFIVLCDIFFNWWKSCKKIFNDVHEQLNFVAHAGADKVENCFCVKTRRDFWGGGKYDERVDRDERKKFSCVFVFTTFPLSTKLHPCFPWGENVMEGVGRREKSIKSVIKLVTFFLKNDILRWFQFVPLQHNFFSAPAPPKALNFTKMLWKSYEKLNFLIQCKFAEHEISLKTFC